MFDEIDGLPLHPLAVHAPVVLIPLMALVALAYVVVPPLRRHLAVWLVLFSASAAGSAFVAVESGKELAAKLGTNPDIERHQGFGEKVLYLAVVVAVMAFVLVVVDFVIRARRRRLERLQAEAVAVPTTRPATKTAAVSERIPYTDGTASPKPAARTTDGPSPDGPTAEGTSSTTEDSAPGGPTAEGSTPDGPAAGGSTSDGPATQGSTSDGPRTRPEVEAEIREPVVTAPVPPPSSGLVVLRVVSIALSVALLATVVAVVVYVVKVGDSGARMVW